MAQISSLDISKLDFDDIKENLKTFLQAQTEFTDYDFEGSALSVLLDVLSYNTHYNAYLANMLINEMFLDSAVKRASAVSIAKHLGYTPRSARSARAYLNLVVNEPTGSPASLSLPIYTPFATTIDGTAYTFYTTAARSISPTAGSYSFSNVEVIEGTLSSFNYVVDTPGFEEKYEIPEINVDTTTLTVNVQGSASNTTTETFTLATDITGLNGTSKVYFLEENPSGRYQIYFGDDVIGKKLTAKNIVNLQYLVSNGTGANTSNAVSQSFTSSSIGGSTSVDVTVVAKSASARERETLTEIKFNAPLVNSAKNRAVTATDYKALVESNFPDAESVAVWGGEENIPPKYGKVIISLKPFSGFTISQTSKNNLLTSILSNKKVLTVQPEIVDPDYYYVNLSVNVEYSTRVSSITSDQVELLVRNVVGDYFNTELQRFDLDFNKSKLIRRILESDNAIQSVIMTVKLQKRKNITVNARTSFLQENELNFNNKIAPGLFTSTRFYITSNGELTLVKFADIPSTMPPDPNGIGTIRIVNAVNGAPILVNAGTINYSTGVVSINEFTPTGLQTSVSDIRFTAGIQETSHNVQVYRNQILLLDDSGLNASIGRDRGLTVNVTALT